MDQSSFLNDNHISWKATKPGEIFWEGRLKMDKDPA